MEISGKRMLVIGRAGIDRLTWCALTGRNVYIQDLTLPSALRKTLTCTNPIESMFSTVRDCEGNIKRYRNSAMSQRWLATVLLHCEKGFRRVKGYLGIPEVIATIEQIQEEKDIMHKAA